MKTVKERLEANIWKYYLFVAFRYCTFFFMPIIVLFFQEQGLSIVQIMILQSVYAISIVIFEVPTGAIADIIGRKKTTGLGALFVAFAVVQYIFAQDFMGFIVADIFYAMGFALTSGADVALIYDSLKSLGKEKMFTKIRGRANAIGFFAAAFASISSGWLYSIDIRIPLMVSIVPLLFAMVVAYTMYEPKRVLGVVTFRNALGLMADGVRYTATHVKLRWIIIYASGFLAFSRAGFWLYQPFLVSVGVEIVYFGIIFAGINLFVSAGSNWAHLIEERLGEKNSLILISTCMVLSFVFFSFESVLFGIVAIVLGQLAFGFSTPVISDYINRHVSSKNRATVLSVSSLSKNIAIAIVLPFVGFLVEAYSLSDAFLMSAGILFIINIVFYIMRKLI
ncbi:MFS transporter [archaeon]|nr:MFS transporter [archaeon]